MLFLASKIDNSKHHEFQAILEQILENSTTAVESIEDPKLKDKNKAELSNLIDKTAMIQDTLLKISKQKRITTDTGKVYYSQVLDKLTKLRRKSRNVSNFNDLWIEINDLFDDIALIYDKVKIIPYNHGGITIMGFGIIFIPFYNIIALAIGGYLLYVGDSRSKTFGALILAGLASYMIALQFLFG